MIGQKFIIKDAGWRNDRQLAFFTYEIHTDEKTFLLEETLQFPVSLSESTESEKLLRALHIALAISYYKSFLPPVIEHKYAMTAVESEFWNTVYRNGLGEFLYKNTLSSDQLATFSSQEGIQIGAENTISSWKDIAELGIGGGKDSIVAGELLKEANIEISGFVLATGEILGQTKAVSDVMEIDLTAVKRVIDGQILDINKLEGAYNGHIPISLIFGLVGAMIAVSKEHRYVIVANEASASIPQTTWEGTSVNHQWSKSLEFERLFQDYLHAYVSEELSYFSAIRPLTSVAIAKLFAQYPKYYEVFTSDNSLFKINQQSREHPRWSSDSSKSLSSFILLAPWITDDELVRIFGQNFLNREDLTPMVSALLGENGQTVLDCVGTPEELASCLAELTDQDRFTDSALLTYTIDKKLLVGASDINSFLTIHEHAMPDLITGRLIEQLEL